VSLCPHRHFRPWAYVFCKTAIAGSNRFPHISGFYKLLGVAMYVTDTSHLFAGLAWVNGAVEVRGLVVEDAVAAQVRPWSRPCRTFVERLHSLSWCCFGLLSLPLPLTLSHHAHSHSNLDFCAMPLYLFFTPAPPPPAHALPFSLVTCLAPHSPSSLANA
jgi:hypothetical protein